MAALEAENAQLREKLQDNQRALHHAVTSRDSRIEALQRPLASGAGTGAPAPEAGEVTLSGH